MANQCYKLSVQLLEQCNNTEEVQILLQESAGSSKYIRHFNEMKYPRLRLAIEHNRKEFVGHMFCQQILRQQWHARPFHQAVANSPSNGPQTGFHNLLHIVQHIHNVGVLREEYTHLDEHGTATMG